MELYREKLKIQNITMTVCCVILAAFTVLGFLAEAGLVELTPVAGDSHWQSQWRGFLSGASFGILAMMVYGLVRNVRAMKDEKALKKLYIKENDERQIQIWTSARAASVQVFLLLGLAACVVAGYFSAAVSLTILVCIFAQSLIGVVFKIYYSKKY